MSKPKQAGETSAERANSRIAAAMAQHYFDKIAPVENRAIEQVMNPDQQLAVAMGRANLDRQLAMSNTDYTLGLGAGRRNMALSVMPSMAGAAAAGAGGTISDFGQNRMNQAAAIVSAGQGNQQSTTAGMMSAASDANRNAILKMQAANQARAMKGEAFGTLLGLGGMGVYNYMNPPGGPSGGQEAIKWQQDVMGG